VPKFGIGDTGTGLGGQQKLLLHLRRAESLINR